MILLTNNEATPGVGVTARQLAEGRPGLDAVEAGIRLVEADESIRTVGRGGWPNLLGDVELDASVMDGGSLRSGAVGGLRGFLHPISVARQVMERLPHVFLVGDGAARFAREIGAEETDNLIEDSKRVWENWLADEVPADLRKDWPDVPLAELCRHTIDPEVGRDTTVFLAQDRQGEIVAGGSTSGWGWKYPGRLGDTPVIGAGLYADTRYGACACTGAGEMTIRTATSRSVVLYMKTGMTLAEAMDAAVEDMAALKGGLINRVTVHAIDRQGGYRVVAVNGNPSNTYWLWEEGQDEPTQHTAEIVEVHDRVASRTDPGDPVAGAR